MSQPIDLDQKRKIDYSQASDKALLALFLNITDFLTEEERTHFVLFLQNVPIEDAAKQLNMSVALAQHKREWAFKNFLEVWRGFHPDGVIV